jgi:hypothetical protein
MSKVQPLRAAPAAPAYEGDVGEVRVEVRQDAVVLRPPAGRELRIEIRGDAMTLVWGGDVAVQAPDGELRLQGRDVVVQADKTLSLHAGEEVDVHSRVGVEIRADHHVNLWGHGVHAGD